MYGFFTDVNQRPQESRPEPRVERPPVIIEARAPDKDSERPDRESEKVAHEKVPERAERAHDRGSERPMRRERSAEEALLIQPQVRGVQMKGVLTGLQNQGTKEKSRYL